MAFSSPFLLNRKYFSNFGKHLKAFFMKNITILSIALLALATTLSSCTSLSNSSKDYVEYAGCELNMKMIFVEGGSFKMGATSEQKGNGTEDEYPIHTVTLDSYYIGECEVTQEQWEKIMGTSIFRQQIKANYNTGYAGIGNDYPMYYINWSEAEAFCYELSRRTGRTYRLPTEAQWEYAARGGIHHENTMYSGSNDIDSVSCRHTSSTYPVKQKLPNKLGLYDMSGNVWEWCSDWYGEGYYSFSPQHNPTGSDFGVRRILRGGSWTAKVEDCRVSNRARSNPIDRDDNNGFRVVCIP